MLVANDIMLEFPYVEISAFMAVWSGCDSSQMLESFVTKVSEVDT